MSPASLCAGSIEFRVLGRTELTVGAAAPQADLLRRPKRLALLTYLLIARPWGFHRRDRLLALFWPEQPEGRARHALRQALHEIRRDVGRIIVARGADEVCVALDAVTCDALSFDDAMRERDLVRAVSLYGGELLDGLAPPSVSAEFQDWLDRERARYRDDAARAACGLAERAGLGGDLSSAVRWARRAASVSPLDESVLHRLLTMYHHIGYRAAAESLYRLFEKSMRNEFAIEPSREIRLLMERVRSSSEPMLAHAGAD